MKTHHRIFYADSSRLDHVESESVDLVVTSPPYPMIQMWDESFSLQDKKIRKSLDRGDGASAFEQMHRRLDRVWDEAHRVLKTGGIAAINIGDATRTINSHFALYPNHSRIQSYMQAIGFSALPLILWRKQTNAPNKFMGSGMMPPGAYVTLEHEYILILRKGNKRVFTSAGEKQNRRESAYFWEERNIWFSDIWTDLKGVPQNLFDPKVRNRSAAFPFELPYRLICMFSVKGDTILDPFLGIGTSMCAAMASARHSIGYEIDPNFKDAIASGIDGMIEYANDRVRLRLRSHCDFAKTYFKRKGEHRHVNKPYGFPVVTKQETDLFLNPLKHLQKKGRNSFEAAYSATPQEEFVCRWADYNACESEKSVLLGKKNSNQVKRAQKASSQVQQTLFD